MVPIAPDDRNDSLHLAMESADRLIQAARISIGTDRVVSCHPRKDTLEVIHDFLVDGDLHTQSKTVLRRVFGVGALTRAAGRFDAAKSVNRRRPVTPAVSVGSTV